MPCAHRPVGLKYEKAREWRIPCVNVQWLSDILLGNLEALRQAQCSRYSVFNLPDPFAPAPPLVFSLLGELSAWPSPPAQKCPGCLCLRWLIVPCPGMGASDGPMLELGCQWLLLSLDAWRVPVKVSAELLMVCP